MLAVVTLCFEDGASLAWFELLEEVVALVVYENECWEVFHFNLPYSLHAEFGILNAFYALDVVLCKDGCRTTDGAKVESLMVFACVCDIDRAVALGEHDA